MYPEAAKIVRLLEGARLVIDLDASSLGAQGLGLGLGYSAEGQGLGIGYSAQGLGLGTAQGPGLPPAPPVPPVKPSSQVESVRAALARKWTALLIGSSLNKLQNKVIAIANQTIETNLVTSLPTLTPSGANL